MKVRLSQKGWVVIPVAFREKYGLKPGSDVQMVDYGSVLDSFALLVYLNDERGKDRVIEVLILAQAGRRCLL